MRELKQSTAANLMVFMTDSSDHVTGKTGLTLTITASKDGAAFASVTPTVTERGTGWYSLALTTAHTDTLGDLAFHVTGSGADPSDLKALVVANLEADTFARIGATGSGLTSLASQASVDVIDDFLDTEVAAIKAKTDQLTFTTTGRADVNVQAWADLTSVVTVSVLSGEASLPLVAADLRRIHGDALTETDGQLAGRFTDFFNQSAAAFTIATALSTHTAADVWAVATRTLTLTGNRPLRGAALANLDFAMYLSSNGTSLASGVTVTAQIRKDGGSFTGVTNAPTEVGSTGVYTISSLTATEMTADKVTLLLTGSGCVAQVINIFTEG